MTQTEGAKMTSNEFMNLLVETLELEEPLHENTAIADIPGWDSMSQIMVIANTQMATGVQMQLAELVRCSRVKDIITLLGPGVIAE
ncbi:MAG: hypothetical protein CVV64_13915 [Candidatus Wallbacteria bacterium HGW-Wallbacteria-1]|jgi:acyl carrier protein|uniref:Carrier domain-containing protein n=1 Tax=Candidatus Wallbacteria bacterium HGW-Wallbacteria-1 TaxID=2013854 RepID=A0A2N1PMD6_9BACT|nr:MAG: hypothetical protein CVV64_13915 [Candidatus Wallbacteria bacterium HGW-Wallbacteria-1]